MADEFGLSRSNGNEKCHRVVRKEASVYGGKPEWHLQYGCGQEWELVKVYKTKAAAVSAMRRKNFNGIRSG